MRNTLCIYHGSCQDGFAAAWVVRKAFKGDVEMFPAVHGEPLPVELVANRNVVIVDFCYPPAILQRILQVAHRVTVLDHHVSSKLQYPHDMPIEVRTEDQLLLHFDMEHSGCMLAWRHFFPDEQPPKVIQHIEDRDLWRFSIPGTAEISAAIFSYPYEFNTWDSIINWVKLEELRAEGKTLVRKQAQDIDSLLPLTQRETEIAGHAVLVANLPMTMVSDAAHRLAVKRAFGACYWDSPGWRNYSLRSTEGGVDVSEIASAFGGGGHKRAAGFRVRLDQISSMGTATGGIAEWVHLEKFVDITTAVDKP